MVSEPFSYKQHRTAMMKDRIEDELGHEKLNGEWLLKSYLTVIFLGIVLLMWAIIL